MITDPRFIPGEGRTGAAPPAFSLAGRGRRWSATRAKMDVIEL